MVTFLQHATKCTLTFPPIRSHSLSLSLTFTLTHFHSIRDYDDNVASRTKAAIFGESDDFLGQIEYSIADQKGPSQLVQVDLQGRTKKSVFSGAYNLVLCLCVCQ